MAAETVLFDGNLRPISEYKEFLLTHYKQRFHWDCGLSCIIMLLPKYQRERFLQDFDKICLENGFGQSTWTIDLCFVLSQLNISFRYLTKTFGVNPEYESHSYYRNIISKDEERVNRKFDKAISMGMAIEKRTISFQAIIEHMTSNGPVILLVNAALLYCDICKKDQYLRTNRYYGHYVVLCGYDLRKRKVKYRNPAKENHICITAFAVVDAARIADGTDEDTILIHF